MNFCAIDWTELIKILTPFIIAYAVYRVWHNQKGKEVIANTAKDCIMDIFGLMASAVIIQHSKARDSKEYEEALLDFNKLISKNIQGINFILSSVDDDKLKNAQDKHGLNCGKVMKYVRAYNNISDKNQNIESYLSTEDFNSFHQSSKDLVDCLRSYAIYGTRFKFRKTT